MTSVQFSEHQIQPRTQAIFSYTRCTGYEDGGGGGSMACSAGKFYEIFGNIVV